MGVADTSTPVSGVTPATEGVVADAPAQESGVIPATETGIEPPKAAEGSLTAEGGPVSGVTPAADPKAASEVSPWENLTSDVPELDEGGPWTEYLLDVEEEAVRDGGLCLRLGERGWRRLMPTLWLRASTGIPPSPPSA